MATRKKCTKIAKHVRSKKWAAFKKKHTKPGMGKAAYKKAVAKHWKPAEKKIIRKKRACKRRAKK